MTSFLSQLHPDLLKEIMDFSSRAIIPIGTEILREGQYVKVIPLVESGLVKVYTKREGRELLLYYIKPGESCIMSFAASLRNSTSKIYAVTEEETEALLIPVEKVGEWIRKYPDFNRLYFDQYNLRYADMLDTIHHVLFDRLDKRVLEHLREKVLLTKKNPLKISHRQLANELGTAREVVSRVMKKLESDGKLIQHSSSIELVDL